MKIGCYLPLLHLRDRCELNRSVALIYNNEIDSVSLSRSLSDIELATPTKEHPNGFASVAEFIARDKDNTSTIYCRFDRLTARNLLYLQSKLQKLEAIQEELDEEVLLTKDRESKKVAASWEAFGSLAKTRESETKRMEVAKEIERAIQTYHR